MTKWKLVPVEPTPEIDYAMRQELPDNQETYGASFLVRAIWKAALAAAPTPPEVEPVAEIVSEELGQPFSSSQIRAHFYKAIPPVGTKLYTSPPSPAYDELSKAAEDAIFILRRLSVDANLTESWRDKADRAANELYTALEKKR